MYSSLADSFLRARTDTLPAILMTLSLHYIAFYDAHSARDRSGAVNASHCIRRRALHYSPAGLLIASLPAPWHALRVTLSVAGNTFI
jgi:hypothetical protein